MTLRNDILDLKNQLEHDKEMKIESFIEKNPAIKNKDFFLLKKEIQMLQKFINQLNNIITINTPL